MTPEAIGRDLAHLLSERRRLPGDREARVGYVTILSVDSPYARVRHADDTEATYPHGAITPIVGARWRVLWALGTGLLDDWAPERPSDPYIPDPSPEDDDEMIAYLGTVTLTPGSGSAGSTPVSGLITDTAEAPLTAARAIVELMVSDGNTDAEPSATATIVAGGTGDVLAGAGTATVHVRADTSSLFTVDVEDSTSTRYLWTRQGPGSPVWVRQAGGPTAVSIA